MEILIYLYLIGRIILIALLIISVILSTIMLIWSFIERKKSIND